MDRIPTGRSKSARLRPLSSARSNISNSCNNTLGSELESKGRPQSARAVDAKLYDRPPRPKSSVVSGYRNVTADEDVHRLDDLKSMLSSTSTQQNSISTLQHTNLNDPLLVLRRPFSPSAKVPTAADRPEICKAPYLPKSVSDPLLLNYEDTSGRKYRRPLSCPEEFITDLQAPRLFDKSSLDATVPDEAVKLKLCRSFIERNRDRMWQLDVRRYHNKTPRTICDEIVNDPNYMAVMVSNHAKEKMFEKSNSEKVRSMLIDSHEVRHPPQDPFHINSLATSRDDRKAKVERLLAPALLQHGRQFSRGYNHDADVGTFSKYNGFLKNNQHTLINR